VIGVDGQRIVRRTQDVGLDGGFLADRQHSSRSENDISILSRVRNNIGIELGVAAA